MLQHDTNMIDVTSRRAQHKPGVVASMVLTALMVVNVACGGKSRNAARPDSKATCEGGRRRLGEQWLVECNTCTCVAADRVLCTRMACDVPAPTGVSRRF